MQTNGNLELHKRQIDEWRIIWASRTSGAGDPPYLLGLKQSNNKLKICDRHYNITWKSDSSNAKTNKWTPGGYAILQNDGNFVIYDGKNRTVWSTGTSGGNKSTAFGTGILHDSIMPIVIFSHIFEIIK